MPDICTRIYTDWTMSPPFFRERDFSCPLEMYLYACRHGEKLFFCCLKTVWFEF